jgi:lipopolysaccharide biosynthesis regulator YciM
MSSPTKPLKFSCKSLISTAIRSKRIFALGNLFRRRGEVERAIRIHQNLIERGSLSNDQRTLAVLELGEDYMRAGLLDRAEVLFSDLVRDGTLAPKALRHLISIYQQERDWEKAIEHAVKLERATGEPMGSFDLTLRV